MLHSPNERRDFNVGEKFLSLCNPDKVDKRLVDNRAFYNISPGMCLHNLGSSNKYENYVVLGTCGVPGVCYDHYDKVLDVVFSQKCGYVCLLDTSCESGNLTDALRFVSMVLEYLWLDIYSNSE